MIKAGRSGKKQGAETAGTHIYQGGNMAGLRERKKKKTREDIVSAAQEAFMSGGYSGVSMEEIAEKAGIGVGTLYNYFQSKADIFISIMYSDFKLRDTKLAADILNNDPAAMIFAYLKQMSVQLRRYDKRVWRELFAALFGRQLGALLYFGHVRLSFYTYRLVC